LIVAYGAGDDRASPFVKRMCQDVEQVTALDVEDDVLEPDAALRPDRRGRARRC
jgi:hypothetical protein